MSSIRILLMSLALLALGAAAARAECDLGGLCCNDDVCCSDARDNDEDGLVDCDDPSCAGLGECPGGGAPESDCANGEDDDGDGAADCDDEDCAEDPACEGGGEGESDCADGEDNDGDEAADCDDEDCAEDPACGGEGDCADGEDGDGDGLVDCMDTADCSGDPACFEDDCGNGADDDGDGATDCADVDCTNVGCCPGPEICDDLRDNNLDGLIDCEDEDSCIDADVCAPPPEICDDEEDNDEDGLTDCEDPECVRFAGCPEPPGPPPPPQLEGGFAVLACLWPPNHGWACFGPADFDVEISGGCGTPTLVFLDCSSNQPADDRGDGSTSPDCVITEGGICIRAERDGRDPDGRTYTILAMAVDSLGQTSEPQPVGVVHVPHDGNDRDACPIVRRPDTRTLGGE